MMLFATALLPDHGAGVAALAGSLLLDAVGVVL
jgi:hypothetical protein